MVDSQSVVPFTSGEQLEAAGQSILNMLHRAADVAKENSQQSLEMAQRVSNKLRAAEDRIMELEAEVALYQQNADHAEWWLQKIRIAIDEELVQPHQDRRRLLLRGK
jgi:hypothetical protein